MRVWKVENLNINVNSCTYIKEIIYNLIKPFYTKEIVKIKKNTLILKMTGKLEKFKEWFFINLEHCDNVKLLSCRT